MKRKKKLNIIPFLISVLIVLAAVGGIALYSFNWTTNHERYLNHMYDNTDERTTLDVVKENFLWTSDYYAYNPGKLTYRDYRTKNAFSEVPFTNIDDGKVGVYYKDGVLHIEGWFDLTLFSSLHYSSDEGENGGYVISYYFVFTNINNNMTSDFDPANVGIIFVDGIGEGSVDENDEDAVATGDTALNTYMNELKADEAVGTNAYYLSYAAGDITYRVVDETAVNKDADTVSYVHRIIPLGGKDDKTYFNKLEDITFAIYYESESITELVEGTLTDLPTADDYVQGKVGTVGYSEDYSKAPYLAFIWPRMLLHCGITLLLAGIVAILFYFIWDTEPVDDKRKFVESKKKK